jgi:hypothetical protein
LALSFNLWKVLMKRNLAALLCSSLLVAACGPVTADNYARLKTGMSHADVVAVLGQPSQCTDVLLVKQCSWGDESRYIKVSYAGDAVLTTSAQGLR